MAYIDVNFTSLGYDLALNRVVSIADRAWNGYNGRDLTWRKRYYSGLFKNLQELKRAARVFDFQDERKDIIEACAFVLILKLEANAARSHMLGHLSEYDFSRLHVAHPNLRQDRTFHYIQSTFVELDHRNSLILTKRMRFGILDLLRAQRCGTKGHPYTIYLETDLSTGRNLALHHGFQKVPEGSAENCELYELSSEAADNALVREINSWV